MPVPRDDPPSPAATETMLAEPAAVTVTAPTLVSVAFWMKACVRLVTRFTVTAPARPTFFAESFEFVEIAAPPETATINGEFFADIVTPPACVNEMPRMMASLVSSIVLTDTLPDTACPVF